MLDQPTPITDQQMKALMGSLNPSRIARRSQGGRSLSYLEGWDVKATLIRVFGFGGFDSEVIETKIVDIERIPSDDPRNTTSHEQVIVLAQVSLRLAIHQTGAVYCETAASSQKGRDVGEVADFAIKTAATDALKRCAINLGTQFGLSLYNNGATADVIRVVFAPGQEWGLTPVEPTEEQAETLAHSLGQRSGGDDPSADVQPDPSEREDLNG